MRLIVATFWLAWIGGLGITLLMIGPFFVAVLFGGSQLADPLLGPAAAGMIGAFGGALLVAAIGTAMSMTWFQRRRFRRAWLAVLIPYAALAAEISLSLGLQTP